MRLRRTLLLRYRIAGYGRPPNRQHYRLLFREPRVIDSVTPHHVITLLGQEHTATREFYVEATADEDQESRSFLTSDPLHSLVATRVDAPFDLYILTVTRICDVLEVPEEPSPVQRRVLASVAHIHTVVHVSGR